MFRDICGILVLTFLIHGGQSDLPPGIVRCFLADGECFKREMQSILHVLQNDPSLLNVKNIQPFIIEDWSVPPGHSLNFEQKYKNVKLFNHHFNKITHAVVEDRVESQVFDIYFENPQVAFVADYEFKNASFKGVSVTSRGTTSHTVQDYHGFLRMFTSFVERNNKKHLTITDVTLSCTPSGMVFKFETGEGLTDERIEDVFNNNWFDAAYDALESYENLVGQAYRQVMQAIFDKFPCEELFLDFVL